jgi:hypothetical protein
MLFFLLLFFYHVDVLHKISQPYGSAEEIAIEDLTVFCHVIMFLRHVIVWTGQ